mmetsp:Transcript_1966/g.2436  ORF Transcript_1966/g.2436 Transcript_1966/m.2436 type:complete len:190 (+) Transcript_1966:174-743(+)|eukprot:jgi/Bigna1/52205/estExt_Genewise1Plus.C_60149
MPLVTIIGEILGCSGFGCKELQVEYKFITEGDKWKCVKGLVSGTTWVAEEMIDKKCVLNHPIQVQYAASGLHGWPKLRVQVNSIDDEDRIDLAGYGFCHVPLSSGMQEVEIVTSRPQGDFWTSISSSFVGGFPKLKNPDVIAKASSKNIAHNVHTQGIVHVKFSVITSNIKTNGTTIGESKSAQLWLST